MKKKVRVLRRKPSPCDEVEDNRTEFQQKIPVQEIQDIKVEPGEEDTQGDFLIKPEPIDDPQQASELDDIPTDFQFKNEPELNIIHEDFPADFQENSTGQKGLESAIEIKMENTTNM
jgi:hypothetical protein